MQFLLCRLSIFTPLFGVFRADGNNDYNRNREMPQQSGKKLVYHKERGFPGGQSTVWFGHPFEANFSILFSVQIGQILKVILARLSLS